ncbi:male sterility [Fusarium albosuccineum]|uniref:gluconokinase n=1 Tax=Fusarium albosuccineum TaxID=1237068 RepID=A0A8H4PF77_9HYPO|nr:male sterility [Fusarium albosuccineum]
MESPSLHLIPDNMPASVYIPSPLEGLPSDNDVGHEVKTTVAARVVDADDSKLRTVDGLVRQRASLYPHDHAVSYPSSGTEYIDYTLQQLDVFAWRVAKHYEPQLPIRTSSAEKSTVVAMLGPSNLEYLITMLALNKLGHTALLLSTRIPQIAIESLVQTTGATAIVADGRFLSLAEDVAKAIPTLQSLQIAGRDTFEYTIEAHGDTQLDSALDPEIETDNIAWIIHSSSTGLPKPIYQTQRSCLPNYATHMNMRSFITLPLFHNHGICNMFRAIHSRKAIHLYNADLPLTQEHLVNIMRKHKFEIFYGVPYALKLLSETEEGIRLLRDLKVVMYGGSACPDDLGNLLVDNGVNLVGHYGATEVGQLMTSFRSEGDKAWNYVRENDKVAPFLKWVPRGPNLYECCVTDGWPAKVQSNQPDNSYATKDLFEPHPTIPRAWKYIARIDDTIVLVNGEKFNPLAMEGSIRSNKNIKEAVVFGAGRPYLGILVVPAERWAGASEDEILQAVWPVVESANHSADAFARISKGMIKLLPWDCEYPRTDKGSVIRQACYKSFKNVIDEAYDLEDVISGDLKQMDISELQAFIKQLVVETLSLSEAPTEDADFFTMGLDSLQAIQMRSSILKAVDIGGKKLGQNVVFEHPSIQNLSQFLLELRLGQDSTKTAPIEQEMSQLIEKYGVFTETKPSAVVITGATGSLGAHVVAKLAADDSIDRIYCLVRASDDAQALSRVKESMLQRRVYHSLPLEARRKIVALPSDLSGAHLGLPEETYLAISDNLRSVIHCAWSVNFNMQLSSFEKGNIAGVKHLINLCQAAQPSASMNFCSSVSTCSRATTVPVPEAAPPLEWAQGMGYAQSKSVSEHICAKAAQQGVTARVLRVGQIVADTQNGVWNAQEAVPMMMQTAVTIGALPKLKETPSWLPVDVVASAVADISLSDAGSVFTNVANPRTFDWTNDLLPALRQAGLVFDELEPKEWVQRLRDSTPDPTVNPPIKLVDFFASKYDKDEFAPSKAFATDRACQLSPALANAAVLDQDMVNKFVSFFLETSWKPRVKDSAPTKVATIIAGPCGSGKSTVGAAVSSSQNIPFVEGDSLHTRSAVEKMQSGTPLTDEDRSSWLNRICGRAQETLFDLDYDSVIVSCSALTAAYRAVIRQQLQKQGVKVSFVDLQASEETLTKRLQSRQEHYMGPSMVNGQVNLYENASADEVDVFPVDAEAEKEKVIEEVAWFVSRNSS